MSDRERVEALADLLAETMILPDVIEHEGDCASSVCEACGHCLHSIAECECATCGCWSYVESDEASYRRRVASLLTSIPDLLAEAKADALREAVTTLEDLALQLVMESDDNPVGNPLAASIVTKCADIVREVK